MPAADPSLAGSAAAGPTASRRCHQSQARRGATCAPSACPSFGASSESPRSCGGAWSRSKKFFLSLPRASGRGAMIRPQSWAAIRHTTAAQPAARRFAGCWIASASGFGVALSKAAANAPRSIKPFARGVLDSKPTQPARRHHGYRRDRANSDQQPCRSAVDGPVPQAP
jgi:hypothetical protein